MAADRESMLAKIRALSAKTVASGCTEEEALMAAQKVAELLDRYGFDSAELGKIEKEEIVERTLTECGTDIGNLIRIASAVAHYCDAKVWKVDFAHPKRTEVRFFGRTMDLDLAVQLMVSFQHAMLGGWMLYKKKPENRGVSKVKNAQHSYEMGMMSRLHSRLYELKAQRSASVDEKTGRTGQSLVVVRTAEVEEAFEAHGVKLGKLRATRAKHTSGSVYRAGFDEGGKVNITTGIGAG